MAPATQRIPMACAEPRLAILICGRLPKCSYLDFVLRTAEYALCESHTGHWVFVSLRWFAIYRSQAPVV
jgi:hypothetical protein